MKHPEWIQQICQGEGAEEAKAEMYKRFQPPLVRIAGTIVDRNTAEDMVQDVFVMTLNCEKLAPFMEQSESALRNWLITIAKNRCIDFRRRAKKSSSLGDQAKQIAGQNRDPDDDPYYDRREAFSDCRQQLTPRQDQVIQLVLAGETSESIAKIMNLTVESVYKLRAAAMKALKKCTEGKLL